MTASTGTKPDSAPAADLEAFKRRQEAVWSAGDYPAMAVNIAAAGERLVGRLGVGRGDRVLDVACGDGNAAIPAARAGARVVGLDLTADLLAAGRRRAAASGVEVDWVRGDAEALPFPDGAFDVVMSTFGCMFAPRHRLAASELARVLRPGGRLGVCTWTPEGAIGEFFRTVGAYMPPPPPFAQSPILWGTEAHVRELFEGTGVELEFARETVRMRDESMESAMEDYATKFGPVVMARRLLEPQGRWPDLERDLIELFTRLDDSAGATVEYDAEYLVVTGRRRG